MEGGGADLFLVVLLGFFLMLLMVAFIVIMVIYHRQRQIQNRQKVEHLHAEYEKTILNVEKEIQEETLVHVGRELHDNIGQLLSLIKINLSSSKPEKIQESRQLISQTIKEVRALSKTLNLDWVEDIHLEDFILSELQKLERAEFCKINFKNEIPEIKISKEEKLVLIRVIQECLNNAIKHAQPEIIEVLLTKEVQDYVIWIKDRGKGFDTRVQSTGMGLNNLQKRMNTIGGDISIKSIIGKGTEIKLLLPIQNG